MLKHRVCSTCRGKKRALDPMGLELQVWATMQVLGIVPGSSERAASVLNGWAISSPYAKVFKESLNSFFHSAAPFVYAHSSRDGTLGPLSLISTVVILMRMASIALYLNASSSVGRSGWEESGYMALLEEVCRMGQSGFKCPSVFQLALFLLLMDRDISFQLLSQSHACLPAALLPTWWSWPLAFWDHEPKTKSFVSCLGHGFSSQL